MKTNQRKTYFIRASVYPYEFPWKVNPVRASKEQQKTIILSEFTGITRFPSEHCDFLSHTHTLALFLSCLFPIVTAHFGFCLRCAINCVYSSLLHCYGASCPRSRSSHSVICSPSHSAPLTDALTIGGVLAMRIITSVAPLRSLSLNSSSLSR